MTSERVVHFVRNQSHEAQVQDNPKQKLQRRSTRITNSPEIRTDTVNYQQLFQNGCDVASPIQSSQQASSVQVKYLSYLAKVIDSAPQVSDSQQIQQHYKNSQFWNVIYQCAIYVKKFDLRTNIDDDLILQQISSYLVPGRVHPQGKNQMGKELMTNGYFLCAYAIATGRKKKSPFIFKYLMQYFENEIQIQTNRQEFIYLMENYIQTQKTNEILNLPESESTPGSNQIESNEKLFSQNKNTNNLLGLNLMDIIRRPFVRQPNNFYQHQQSQDSKTINLDEFEHQQNGFI